MYTNHTHQTHEVCDGNWVHDQFDGNEMTLKINHELKYYTGCLQPLESIQMIEDSKLSILT